MINIGGKNPQAARIIEALRVGVLEENEKIDAVAFKDAHNSVKKGLLKAAFETAMDKTGVRLNSNFRCINEDHNDSEASMTYFRAKQAFSCYAGCYGHGKTLDVFDLIGIVYDINGFMDKYKLAVKLFVQQQNDVEQKTLTKPSTGDQKHWKKYPLPMYKVMMYPFHHPIASDELGLKYLQDVRGISKETATEMGLRTWMYEGGHWFLVMINDDGSYARRKFFEDTSISGMYSNLPNKWLNSKGSMGVFNLRTIEAARAVNELVFIAEAAIDAMSLIDIGFKAVGLNGLNNIGILDRSTDYPFLVYILDNDKAGIKAAASLRAEGRCAIDVSKYEYLSQYKDVNEALVVDRQKFIDDMIAVAKDAIKHWSGGDGNE